VLVHSFDQVLRLLQPIVPFVTDALWQRLPRTDESALAIAAWPQVRAIIGDAKAFDLVIEAVNAIRRLRADYSVPPGKSVSCTIVPSAGSRSLFVDEAVVAGRLARAEIAVADSTPTESSAHAVLSDGTQVILSLAGVVD